MMEMVQAQELLATAAPGRILLGDALARLREMPAESVDLCVTSPPYWGGLRDYGHPDQLGLEPTVREYVSRLASVMNEVRRALKPTGSLWLNLGDCFAGGRTGQRHAPEPGGGERRKTGDERAVERPRDASLPRGCLVGTPWRVALALLDYGWIWRAEIVWHKPNPMPDSTANRPTRAHEALLVFTKRSTGYTWNAEAIAEPAVSGWSEMRNARDVWTIPTQPSFSEHFAVMPYEIARRAVLTGSNRGEVVLDPFAGAGTTLAAAADHGRRWIGIEINPDFAAIARGRLREHGAVEEVESA